MQIKIIDFNSLITMDIKNEINIAAELLSRTKCPDCGGYHKVELSYEMRTKSLFHNLHSIECGKFNDWAMKRIRILAESINLEENFIP